MASARRGAHTTNITSAVQIVRRFRQARALIIGDAMLDSYLLGSAARLCSEGPVPVVTKADEHRVPGGAANTAANMRSLGAATMYLGVIGGDANGATLRDALRRHGIDDRWLIEDASATTLHKMRILADGQYVVRLDEGDARASRPANQRRILAALEAAYPYCDLVVVSDYAYGLVSNAVIERLRELREETPRPLIVDSKQLLRFRRARATVVTPNWLEARLLVVGGETADPDPLATPEIGALLRLAAELGVSDRVIFTGKQPRERLRDYYCASDVVVTTPWYEPFGLTPLEAMACGRPVVGSHVGGIAFTVVDGKSGYLVPPRDPEALAHRLRMLLADPVSAGRMGRVARRRVEREFTWEQVAQRTAALYESLLAARQRSHAGILSPQSTDIPDFIALFDSALAHS